MSRLLRITVLLSFAMQLLAGNYAFAQTADFTADVTYGCDPLIVNFTDASTGTITSYNWNLGNSTSSTLQNPSATYSTPGNYTVTLQVNGPGGPTKTLTITVYDKPTISFSGTPLAGCAPHNVQFSSTIALNSPNFNPPTYTWDFGDGNSGSGTNPSHLYTYPGTYPVSLTVTNGAGCTGITTINSYVTVHPVPVGGFTATQTAFCAIPSTAFFTSTTFGGTTPYAIGWNFGDGGTGSGSTPSHNYVTGGGFTVTMTVTDAKGCVSVVTAPAYISVNATAPTFTAPTNVCVAADGTYTNTTLGGSSTSWDFDDGTTGSGTPVTHVYASAGTYTVKMTTTIGGCQKTVTKTVIVDPKPTPLISMTPPIPCPAPVPVSFSGSSTPVAISNYAWSWKSGGTATGQTVIKNYTANIEDEVKLVATTASGCMDSVVKDDIQIRNILVNVTPGGFCDVDPYAGCLPLQITFGVELLSSLPPPAVPCGYSNYPLPITTYVLWDFGDGTPTMTGVANPVHTYTAVGDYRVRCDIITSNGCTATGYRNVHVDYPVPPSFYASPLTACTKAPITFFNTTTAPLPNTTYTWIIENDTSISKQDLSSVTVGLKKPGTYTVRLNTNHFGCIDTFVRRDYIVINPPGANFTSNIHCAPSKVVEFTNTSIAATSQEWIFGDGFTSTATSPTHTYAATGTYMVALAAYNSTSGCRDTFRKSITVFDPMIDFIASDQTLCTDDRVRFQAAFTGSGSVMYSWIFDNYQTTFDTATKYDFQYPDTGFHNVRLVVVSGNNCYDTVSKNNFILVSRPIVNFGAYPPIGCEPLPVLFRDSSVNAAGAPNKSFSWTFGDGGTALARTLDTVNHTYYVRGNYTVTLTVVDAQQCEGSLTRTNYVGIHKPQAQFTISDDSVCAYDPVLFNSTSTETAPPLRHVWDFGDGTTDTGRVATHRYAKKGVFGVRLVVIDAVGCTDTLRLADSISVSGPHAAFIMSDSVAICPPLRDTFTNQSTGAISYLWNFGTGGSPVIVPNPITTFQTPGLYVVVLVAKDVNGCTDTAKANVRVLGYNGAFSYTPLIGCAPLTVNFTTPITGIPQMKWVYGDGVITTTSTNTSSHTYLTPGSYMPSVIFSDGALCSSSPSFGLDTIRVDRLDANFSTTVPCVGTPFTLTDNSTAIYNNAISWFWSFGATDTGSGSPVSYTYTTSGTHPVTLVISNIAGCKDTITKDVFINPLPIIDVTNDTGVCPADRVDLIVRGGVGYTWSSGTDSMHNCPVCDTAFVHLDSAGAGFAVYVVTGTDANGCVNKDSVKVSIKLRTDVTIGQGGEICVGESFRLHAEGAQKYEWMPAETIDSPFIASPLATPQRTTTYVVAAREGSCDVDSQYIQVVVHSGPLFSAGNDEVIALGSAITLKPTRSGITRIEWVPDTSLSCHDCFDPTAHPYYTRTYYATGYNEFGCSASDSVTVHVRCNNSLVFIPNSFTPNGDGRNEYFFPRGEGVERMSSFRVFNRWGETVFERTNVALNDERAGWDGTYKGKELPPDVYVYTMQSTCATGEVLQWKGDITLMK